MKALTWDRALKYFWYQQRSTYSKIGHGSNMGPKGVFSKRVLKYFQHVYHETI